MQILSISLKNIKTHEDLELSFVNGINVLSGPNGAGKSTVFEAIGYALFGVDAKDFVGNINRFISIGAKKGEIGVTFTTDDNETYKVTRSVGAGSKWLLAKEFDGTFEIEDHAGIAETETRIKELLKLDRTRSLSDQFKLVIGPFQHEFLGPFILKQPKKRQEMFDEILGIDAWRKTYLGTSTLGTTLKNKIEVLTAQITSRQEQTAVLPERKKEAAALTQEKQALEKQLKEKKGKTAETIQLLTRLDELEKKTNSVKADIQLLEQRIRDGKGKIADQNKRVTEAKEAAVAMDKAGEGKKAFDMAEAKLKDLRKKEKLKRETEQAVAKLDQEKIRLTQTLQHEQSEIENIEKQLAAEETRIKKEREKLVADKQLTETAALLPDLKNEADKLRSALGVLDGRRTSLEEGSEKLTQGTCPFFKEPCLNIGEKAPQDTFSSKIDVLNNERLSLNKKLDVATTKIKTAEKARLEQETRLVRNKELDKQTCALQERREENQKRGNRLGEIKTKQQEAEQKIHLQKQELKKYSQLEAEIVDAEKNRAKHQAARDAWFANQKDAQDLDNRTKTLQKWQNALENLIQTLDRKNKERLQLEKDYDPSIHAKTRLEKDKLVAETASLSQKVDNLNKEGKRLEAEIEKLEKIQSETKIRTAEKKSLRKKQKLVEFLRTRIFNNVSAQLSERFREEISLRADKIYRIIAETDEELYWGENYRIILRDMHNGEIRERSDDQLSGGQIMSAVVALRLALLQTIGARIAFFDEPTSNLDADRRENMAHAFRAIDIGREEVTEHWYDQLFLISHDVAFTEITDQIISLEK